MFEANVNTIIDQTNDQLDILKVYIDYRVAFHVERTLNRLRVLQSIGGYGFKYEFNDVVPIKFDKLKKLYADGFTKDTITRAAQLTINTLNDDIDKLIKV
jgi:hypothetical protein